MIGAQDRQKVHSKGYGIKQSRRNSFGHGIREQRLWSPNSPNPQSKQHLLRCGSPPDNVTDGDVAVPEGDPPTSAAILGGMKRPTRLAYCRNIATLILKKYTS